MTLADGSVGGIFARFTDEVVRAMELGVYYGENWRALPGIGVPANATNIGTWTYETLAGVTDLVIDPSVKTQLVSLCGRAQQDAAQGNEAEKERLLGEYTGILQKVRGTGVSAEDADALIVVAKAL
jgi:hypothetical protein